MPRRIHASCLRVCSMSSPGRVCSVASPPDVMVRGSPMGMYRQDFTVVHMHSRYAPASESIRRQYCRSWLRWCVRALHRARVRASHMLWLGEVGGLAKELVEREAQSRAPGAREDLYIYSSGGMPPKCDLYVQVANRDCLAPTRHPPPPPRLDSSAGPGWRCSLRRGSDRACNSELPYTT